MTEQERIREKITRIVCWHKPNWIPYEQFTKEDRDFGLPKADQILSLDGIEIRAEKQDLPEPSNAIAPNYFEEVLEKKICRNAQQDMLKAGFVKVIPKGR